MPRPFLLLAAMALLTTGTNAQSLTAYPNPYAGGPFTVETDAPDTAFELVDLLGRHLDPGQTLAPGAYLWRLRYADGSRSEARRLTTLTPGPLRVRLVLQIGAAPSATSPASVPRRADLTATRAAKGGGCAPSPGGVLFGGAYHRPSPGVVMSGGSTMVVQGAEGAGFQTCLPEIQGVAYSFPQGHSPWSTAGPADECVTVTMGGRVGDSSVTGSFTTCSTTHFKRAGGASVELRGGIDASVPRLAEVLRYDADGNPSVVSSALIPAGTPLSTPYATVSSASVMELEATVLGGLVQPDNDSLPPQIMAFRSATPMAFQLPGKPAVQGDAVSLRVQIEGILELDVFRMDAGTDGFQVETLGFGSWETGTVTGLANPAWLRMQDAKGLFTMDAGTSEIRCGQTGTCASYGVTASPGFIAYGAETGTAAPQSPVSFPTAGAIYGGPFEALSGRGLLLNRGDQFRTSSDYYIIMLENAAPTEPVLRRAVVTLGKPRDNKTSILVDDESINGLAGGSVPAFDRFRLRYIKNGRVRLDKVFPAGRTLTFKARLEILDALVTSGEDGPLFRYAIALNGGEEFLELEPILDGNPTISGYEAITWAYTEPWTLGFGSWGTGALQFTGLALKEFTEDWGFEVE
ncbi:MAG: hypothetical protein AAGI52_08220 [Bacteroidota bacterium]